MIKQKLKVMAVICPRFKPTAEFIAREAAKLTESAASSAPQRQTEDAEAPTERNPAHTAAPAIVNKCVKRYRRHVIVRPQKDYERQGGESTKKRLAKSILDLIT